MKFILISGKAGSGKDTVAKYMKKELELRGKTVLVTHFADAVKYVCKEYFKWNGEKDEAGRSLLQEVGTEIYRSAYENYWVDLVIMAACASTMKFDWDYVLVPDARFKNEVTRPREFGLDVMHVNVVRPELKSALTEEQQIHSSENDLDGVSPDVEIKNSGDLALLSWTVSDFVKEI